MTSNAKPRTYQKKIVDQASHQLAGITDVEDLLRVMDQNIEDYSFKNLEIFFKDQEVFNFNDLHLLVETIVNEMPSSPNFGKEVRLKFCLRGIFEVLMNQLRFDPEKEAKICKTFLRGMRKLRGFKSQMKEITYRFLDENPNTEIHYMYRCAANYKSHEEIVVAGHLTLSDIQDELYDHNHFIAHQVGLVAPQDNLNMNPELDHCLCELVGIRFTKSHPTEGMTAKQLVQKFRRVEWDFSEATKRYGL